jgi:hypothetical protein
MKVTIELNDCEQYGLSPSFVYKKLSDEYYNKLCKSNSRNLWGLQNACDRVARELYSQVVNRSSGTKNLILTYADAERCFEIFKSFADTWNLNQTRLKK